jgi:hypothetical protein
MCFGGGGMIEVFSLLAIDTVGGFLTELDAANREASIRGYQQQLIQQAQDFQAGQAELRYLRELHLERLRAEAELRKEFAVAALRRDAERASRLERIELDNYPFIQGPGKLRSSLELEYPDPTMRPPVVLLAPPAEDSSRPQPWAGLRHRVLEALMVYQGPLLTTRLVDRPFHWPHVDFYQYDLLGIPALILQPLIADDRVGVSLAGCHLVLGGQSVQGLRRVFSTTFPGPGRWRREDVERLPNPPSITTTDPMDADSLRRLNHELASRVIVLCVIAAIDTFHLQRTIGYDEQFDHAVAATGVAGDDWPVSLGIPLDQMADPAYHLMHTAIRQARRGDGAAAETDIAQAFQRLAGGGVLSVRDAVIDALASAQMHDKHRLKAIEAIQLLPDGSQWRLVALPLLLGGLPARLVAPAALKTPQWTHDPDADPFRREKGSQA